MTQRSRSASNSASNLASNLVPPTDYRQPAILALWCAIAAGCGTNSIDGIDPNGTSGGGPTSGEGTAGFTGGGSAGDFASCGDPSGTGSTSGGGGTRGSKMGGFVTASSPVFDGIVNAADAPPPISGGTLVVLRDGITAVAADADRDRVYIADLSDPANLKVRASIALNLHDQPGRLVQDGAGAVHIVLRNAAALVTIDPVAGKITARRSVCGLPRGLAYDPVADRLHIACAGGQLMTFTPTGATPERTLTLQRDLRDVVVDGPRLIVSRFRSAEAIVLDAKGTMMELIKPVGFANAGVHNGSPFGPAVAWRTVAMPDGGAVMVHQRGMNGTVGRTPGGYGGLSPCDTIVHTSVTRMKAGERPVAGPAMPGFVLPVDIAVSGDGKRVAMIAAGNGHSQFDARKVFVANVDDVTGDWDQGCGMDDKHGPSSTPICGGQDSGPVAPVAPDGSCPMGLINCLNKFCVSPSDFTAFCSEPPPSSSGGTSGATGTGSTAGGMSTGLGGSGGAATAADVATGIGGSGGATSAGAATNTGGATGAGGRVATTGPAAVAGSPGFGGNGGSGNPCSIDIPDQVEPVSVAFAGPNLVVVQTREPAQLWVLSSLDGSTNKVALSQESRADTGHAVFHSNSGGGLACASCHPEGHEDGRVWDFACEGARRTQDIGGGLSGTEPFHWNGDLSSFPTLVDTVFVGRMSGPQLSREQTASALQWINSVPARAGLRSATDPQVVRGKAIFNNPSVACASCHAGASLTNNLTLDVGTSAAFQVPSLRGIGWRSPYMHDGCAPTLAARFGNKFCDGGEAHGKTSQLTPLQIDDLVAFLESI